MYLHMQANGILLQRSGSEGMKKFGVFSGFLGSGKTTTMMALTKYFTEHYGKAAMISNDLGGQGLADNRLANLSGCSASELTGTCICYQTQNLVDRLDRLFDEDGCELVLSDIPGFGIGALDHVYHTLAKDYPDRFTLAPFTVVCEPQTVKRLSANGDGDMEYILKSQLKEADLIVLNKCDLVSAQERENMLAFLKKEYPHADTAAISAFTGEGLDELSQKLLKGCASMHKPDLGYGGEQFLSAIGSFSEYNIQYYAVVCCETFDGNEYLRNMAEKIREKIATVYGGEIPHMKLLAWEPEGDYAKVDILGVNREIESVKSFSNPCREIAVIINTSAVCKSEVLDRLVTETVETMSEQYQLSIMIYKKECFSALGES